MRWRGHIDGEKQPHLPRRQIGSVAANGGDNDAPPKIQCLKFVEIKLHFAEKFISLAELLTGFLAGAQPKTPCFHKCPAIFKRMKTPVQPISDKQVDANLG
jgi:hypothetical protein